MDVSDFHGAAQGFCALKKVFDGDDADWDWSWRLEAVAPNHPLSFAMDCYLVLDKHFRASKCRHGMFVEWEFHITYSLTWAAPVLYLKAVWHDGSTLRPKDVCNELYFEQDDDAAALLSVEDHPFLNEAWCMLHACQTPERMAAIRETAPQMRLLSWFAFTAPTMGLRISPKQWARLVGHLRSGQDAPLFEIEDSDAR